MDQTSQSAFSAVSWNVLADHFLRGSRVQYDHVHDSHLEWQSRKERIVSRILGFGCDILCLQEVEPIFFESVLSPTLQQHGYDGLMNERSCEDNHPGTCTFWRQDRFSLSRYFSQRRTLLVVLQDGQSEGGNCLAVVNVHLQGDPKETVARLRQLQGALEILENLSHEALLVLGDFNSELRDSACTAWLAHGKVSQGTLDWGVEVSVDAESVPWHRYMMRSAYERDSTDFSHTIAGAAGFVGMIDHLWFTESSLQLECTWPLLNCLAEREEVLDRGLPSATHPSDHLPIGATFYWAGEIRDLRSCAPRRADDAVVVKTRPAARIPCDVEALRKLVVGKSKHDWEAIMKGIGELDARHPLLHGVELPESAVVKGHFADLHGNFEIKTRGIAMVLVRSLAISESLRDEIASMISNITFQDEKPSKEDIERLQARKVRWAQLLTELVENDVSVAVSADSMVQFGVIVEGMNKKWAKKLEAAAVNENEDEDDAVYCFDDF